VLDRRLPVLEQAQFLEMLENLMATRRTPSSSFILEWICRSQHLDLMQLFLLGSAD
jgi:hypothetical protein